MAKENDKKKGWIYERLLKEEIYSHIVSLKQGNAKLVENHCKDIQKNPDRIQRIEEFYAIEHYSNGKLDRETLDWIKQDTDTEKIEKVLEPNYLNKIILPYKRIYIGYLRVLFSEKLTINSDVREYLVEINNKNGIPIKDIADAWELMRNEIPDSKMYEGMIYVGECKSIPLYEFQIAT